MAAVDMLDSGYQTFVDFIDMLIFLVATFPPIFVKIGHEMRERHQFFEIQDGGSRHV